MFLRVGNFHIKMLEKTCWKCEQKSNGEQTQGRTQVHSVADQSDHLALAWSRERALLVLYVKEEGGF